MENKKSDIPAGIAYCARTNEFFLLSCGVRKSDTFFDFWVARKDEFPQKDRPKR